MPAVDQKTETRNEALAQLLAAPPSPLDRLPGFYRAVEDYANQFSIQLRMRDGIEGNVHERETIATSLAETLEGRTDYAVIPVDVADWDCRLAIGISFDLVYAVVETMFGGDGTMPPMSGDRAPTRLECKLAQHFLDNSIYALQKSFSENGTLNLKVGSVESNLSEVDFGRKASSIVLARLDIEISGRRGELILIMPKAALEGMRRTGLPGDQGSGNNDPEWADQFSRELQRADVQLRALIRTRSLVLGDIARLAPGVVLPLEVDANANVYLEANEEPIFVCAMGQMEGRYTVRIKESYDMTRILMEEITGQ